MAAERGGIPAPFTGYAATVRPEWMDENGHMNLAHYVTVFDGATDLLWDAIGLGQPYRERTRHGTFAVETHILYRAELLAGQSVRVTSVLLATDTKRLHVAHEMHRDDPSGTALIAQQELMLLHVSLETRRVVPFPPDLMPRIADAARAHASLPRPGWIGRRIAMPA